MLDGLTQFLLWTVLPTFLMFCAERASLRYLIRAPWGKQWVRSQRWLHPNFISRCRYPMGVASVVIFHAGYWVGPSVWFWHHLGTYFFAFWIITDITDGTIARYFDLHTKSGESIDPLSDKLLLFPPLFYFSYLGYIPFWVILLFLAFDLLGQFSRYFIQNRAANLFGKAKTFLAVITIVLLTTQVVYFPEHAPWRINIPALTLYGATFLAFCSMFFKVIPNYWYANILSMLNLACGLAGMVLILAYNMPGMGLAAVFVGQFLDLFDGRAADKWGSTPRGELFDDVADGTSFGGTIALLIWYQFSASPFGLFLALLHLGTTLYRLWRFIRDKRAQGETGGVAVFAGLPSPAGALIAGNAALLAAPDWFRMGLILLSSILMITRIPYIHFGRVILPAIPKVIKAILLTAMLLAILIGFQTRNDQVLYWTVLLMATAYMLLGIPWRGRKAKNQT
ncbi:MAG: CDP-alcohol phosphatidyltransferase family protein [bacterium]|nr:CDP-alcohol phosphatidyltransferase family protein [bacterium]